MIYRNADEALQRRRDELLAERRHDLKTLPRAVVQVYTRRQARRIAGMVGILGANVMAACAALRVSGLTTILQLAWLGMIAVYVVARMIASAQAHRALRRAFVASDSASADVARFEQLTPRTVILDLAAKIEPRSVANPMIALALLLPLTLHYLVVATVKARVPSANEYDGWISMSLLFVGHCHVILAYQAWRFAQSLRNTREAEVVGLLADRAGWRAWGVTIAWSLVGGVVMLGVMPVAGMALLVIAPMLVGATGLAFIPGMFTRMGRKVRLERTALDPTT